MNDEDVRAILARLLAGEAPAMPELWINDCQSAGRSRRLHESSGANSTASIGAVLDFHRKHGYPQLREFMEHYFESGEEYGRLRAHGNRPDPRAFGRTAIDLGAIIADLTIYCAAHPNDPNAEYTEENVGMWFLTLVFIRTEQGGRRERRVWESLGGHARGWRPTTIDEDRKEGIDFIHEHSRTAVQVKPLGWYRNTALFAQWLANSHEHGNRRVLVECDPDQDGPFHVFRIFEGRLTPSRVEEIR